MVWLYLPERFYLLNQRSTRGSAMESRKKPSQDSQKLRFKSQRKSTYSRRLSANQKERRRTQNINTAFAELRRCIPNVPQDTKLSKIRTLRLATSYISYLQEVLQSETRRDTSASVSSRNTRPTRTVNLHSNGNYKTTIFALKVRSLVFRAGYVGVGKNYYAYWF